MGKVLAALTIGQAPRVDLMPDIVGLLPTGVEVREYGALDAMTLAEVEAAFDPQPGEEVLVSRMRDGSQAHFTETFVTPLVQAAIDRAEDEGADVVALFCTGAFRRFHHRKIFLEPHPLLHAVARTMADGAPIGVLVPLADQVEQAYRHWGASGLDVVVTHASPYLDRAEIGRAAETFAGRDLAFVCTDCMGFTEAMRADVEAACGLPVVLPRTLIARVLAEVLS